MRSLRPILKAFSAWLLTTSAIQGETPTTKITELTGPEAFVLECVNAGVPAFLYPKNGVPDKDTVKLRASFLEQLLLGKLPGLKLHRHGVLINGAVIEDSIRLRNAQINCDVELSRSKFSQVGLERANFAGKLSFEHSTFEHFADFRGVRVLGDAQFFNAKFKARVDFDNSHFASFFGAEEAQFSAPVSFDAIKVEGVAQFHKAVFEGPVSFTAAEFSEQLVMTEVEFKSPKTVSFNPLTVKGSAFFHKTKFEGAPNFLAEIGGNFEAQGAEFKKTTDLVWLEIKCGRGGFFRGTKFFGPVSFADSIYENLEISGNTGDLIAPEINLSRVTVTRSFEIHNMKVGNLVARSLRIEGPAEFKKLEVQGKADLRYSDFKTLDLSESEWPSGSNQFQMQGVKYDYITANPANEIESRNRLLTLVQQSAYSGDVYKNLESFFLSQGHHGDANRVFVADKRRQRAQLAYLDPAWIGNLLLDWLIGYGRHPERAGYLCLGIVALGCIVFPLKKMGLQDPKELEKPEEIQSQYNRFWYSLGLFLPIVDLKTSALWKPKRQHVLLRHYVRVHILLGWVLVPIFLAAISGLIK